MDDRAELNRASQARDLLENPLLQEALAAIEQEILDKWKKSSESQSEDRESLYLLLRSKQRFESILKQWISSGKLISLSQTKAGNPRRAGGLL